MRKRWGIWVLFVLGFLCCCLPLLAHLYSQKEQEKVIATYQKTIREQKRDVKELRKQAEHYNSILYQTNGAALSLSILMFVWLGIFNLLPICIQYAIYSFISKRTNSKKEWSI